MSDEAVPKLPRGRGLKFSGPELFRIALTVGMLIAVIALTKPCSNAVSTFVMGFDGSAKGSAMPKPGKADVPKPDPYEHLGPGMTDDEVKAAIERAKAKAGSGASPSSDPPIAIPARPVPAPPAGGAPSSAGVP